MALRRNINGCNNGILRSGGTLYRSQRLQEDPPRVPYRHCLYDCPCHSGARHMRCHCQAPALLARRRKRHRTIVNELFPRILHIAAHLSVRHACLIDAEKLRQHEDTKHGKHSDVHLRCSVQLLPHLPFTQLQYRMSPAFLIKYITTCLFSAEYYS